MKRVLMLLVSVFSFLLPINALAYSEYIIPSGKSIGIEIESDGIMVVGFYKVSGKYNKGNPGLKIGDKITEVEGIEIRTVNDLVDTIEEKMENHHVNLTFTRDNKKYNTSLELINENGTYKTGLYVKDSITGIGTLTYIDPESKIYGALGHEIVESNSNKLVEVKSGSIFRSFITSIDRSVGGTPGGKNAKFYSNTIFGTIEKNGKTGIYGKYTTSIEDEPTMKIAAPDEIQKGKAYIYTVLEGENIEQYEINITKIDTKSDTKNIYFEVTDKSLLEKTGGIVQGMSGSPIIQNDKIVGAVTHVVVSNPASGYGVSIIKMLEEGEK